MQIKPMATPQNIEPATMSDGMPSMSQKIRSLKMNVNRTPGRVEEPVADATTQPPTPQAAVEPTAPTETPTETTAVSEATQPLSPQLSAIAKQRRALQQERQEFEKQKVDFESQKGASGGISVDLLKSNPIGVLLENGFTFDTLAQAVQGYSSGNHEVTALKNQIKTLEESFEKKFSDREVRAEEQALDEMVRESMRISQEGDDFELIRETKSYPKVREFIKRTYQKTGEVVDVREAMKFIESTLYEDILPVTKTKKVMSQFQPSAPAQQMPPQQQRQMRTLTNKDTASVLMSKKARAIAAFNGTLKK
jgi:hypothetical protein